MQIHYFAVIFAKLNFVTFDLSFQLVKMIWILISSSILLMTFFTTLCLLQIVWINVLLKNVYHWKICGYSVLKILGS